MSSQVATRESRVPLRFTVRQCKAHLTVCPELVSGRSHVHACGAPIVDSYTAPAREVIQMAATGGWWASFNATEIAKVAIAAMSRQDTMYVWCLQLGVRVAGV